MAPADDLFNRFLIPLEQDFDLTSESIDKEIAEAAAFAEDSPFPRPEDALALGH